MKNQYVGDIGDYGKYGLLKYLALHDIIIGVNWYLTENDDSNDGKHISYLKDEKERVYDSEVYDLLKRIAGDKYKSVKMIKKAGIIPNALFFDDILNTTEFPCEKRRAIRIDWHAKAMKALHPVQLVFADPDNGTIGTKSPTSKDAEKYTTLEELADYYNRGQDVVYYCQKARRTDDQWNDKKNELKAVLPDVEIAVLTFVRGTRRSYIFGIHPERYAKYDQLIEEFINTDWGTVGKKRMFLREK